MTIKIEKNIPIPVILRKGRNKSETRIAMEKVKIGQSFLTPVKYRGSLCVMSKAVGIKIKTRPEKGGWRVWRIA